MTISGCADCHSPQEKGEPIKGKELAGGTTFNLPFGISRPANITPDKETGIGKWSRKNFIQKFKSYQSVKPVAPGKFNTVMPWNMMSGMTEQDLGAIYAYKPSHPSPTKLLFLRKKRPSTQKRIPRARSI